MSYHFQPTLKKKCRDQSVTAFLLTNDKRKVISAQQCQISLVIK